MRLNGARLGALGAVVAWATVASPSAAAECQVKSYSDLQAQLDALSAAGGGEFVIPPCAAATPIFLDATGAGLVETVTTPPNVLIKDERDSAGGQVIYHSNNADAELRVEDRATAGGEGPSLVLWNTAGSGTRTGSIVTRFGPRAYGAAGPMYGTAAILRFGTTYTYPDPADPKRTYELWDPDVDFQLLDLRGSGLPRSRLRIGSGGTVIVNPNDTDGLPFRIPHEGQTDATAHRFIVNAPEGTGRGNLLDVQDTATTVRGELHIDAANAPLRFYGRDRSGRPALAWSILADYPGAGQLTFYRHEDGQSRATLSMTPGGAMQLQPSASGGAPPGSLFVDELDRKLKFKDESGRVGVVVLQYE